jgi:hypothetical protein
MNTFRFSLFMFLAAGLTFFGQNVSSQIMGSGGWDSAGSPAIEFDLKEFDFGEVPQGDTIRQKYTFRNAGTGELTIKNVKTGCECTSANWEAGPYKMGATGVIEVIFSTKDKSGPQKKEIIVESNTDKRIDIIRLTGVVQLPEGSTSEE